MLSPLGTRASGEAIDRLSVEHDAERHAMQRQVEHLEYAAARAFEQYNAVDARNRLVASELERRWNATLADLARARAQVTALDNRRHPEHENGTSRSRPQSSQRNREPAREPATLQNVPELLLHEAGQAFPVAETRGLRAKGLEVIVHDLVERTLRGTPRFVARRGRGHAGPEGERRASEEADEIGLNARARERQVGDFAVRRV